MFDAHAHLQDPRLADSFDEWVHRAHAAQVTGVCSCGTTPDDWSATEALARQHFPFILIPGFGVHPWYVRHLPDDWQQRLEAFIDRNPVGVIGEIGLDGLNEEIPHDLQEKVFMRQLDLAERIRRPVVLHGARAWGRLLEQLTPFARKLPGFVVHGFSGSAEILKQILNMGGYISISGSVCNRNATKIRTIVKEIPSSQLLIETDAPDLFPCGGTSVGMNANGKPLNHPGNLTVIANEIAALRGLSTDELSDLTSANARRLFL